MPDIGKCGLDIGSKFKTPLYSRAYFMCDGYNVPARIVLLLKRSGLQSCDVSKTSFAGSGLVERLLKYFLTRGTPRG